jgi:H+/Cl- antiporter ClcA
VLFVLEEVIGTWNAVALGAIVIAAIASVVVQHWFLGDQPLFTRPNSTKRRWPTCWCSPCSAWSAVCSPSRS